MELKIKKKQSCSRCCREGSCSSPAEGLPAAENGKYQGGKEARRRGGKEARRRGGKEARVQGIKDARRNGGKEEECQAKCHRLKLFLTSLQLPSPALVPMQLI